MSEENPTRIGDSFVFEKTRRNFLSLIGLLALPALSRPAKATEMGTSNLVALAHERLRPHLKKWGRPSGVFVQSVNSTGEYRSGDHEILRVYWPDPKCPGNGFHISLGEKVDIDLGELHPNPNGHFRRIWRVADELSESLEAAVGWGTDNEEVPSKFPPSL
jgi:hypothetical protein